MGPGDEVRLAVFLTVVGAIYVAAIAIVVRRVGRRVRHEPAPARGTARRVANGVLVLAVIGLLCLGWGFVEPYTLSVTRVRITSAKLSKGARPIRVVHLTDVHSDPSPRLEERLPDAVAAERPDVIVFTGDAVNSEAGVPVFRRLMERLSKVAPTYGIDGNWDVWLVPEGDRYGDTGATKVDGRATKLSIAGTDLWITGVAADGADRGGRALEGVPPGALTLFLYHYPEPEVVPDADRLAGRVDLMLAGHVHGGQVALPFFGAILTLTRHGKKYEHGLFDVGGMHLFVSRGIGMEGGHAPRVRFCAPPEIAVIEIAPRD